MTITRQALAAVLVALLVFAPLSGGALAAATPESASFGDRSVTVVRGDTAEITVSHSTSANLTIGSQEAGFEVVVPLHGSGTDTISLDTYNTTGPASSFISVNGATLKTPELDDSLAAATYTLSVTINGTTEALGTLEVKPRNETTSSVGVAPASLEPSSASAGDVLSQTTTRSTVAHGDYAVFVVNESGLANAFNPDDLSGGAAANGIEAKLVQLDPPRNRQAEEYVATDSSAVTVIPQVKERDRFLVVWDTSELPYEDTTNNTFELRVTLRAEHNNLVESDERLTTRRITLEQPSIQLDARPGFTLAPWDDARMRVEGETNLAPGTTLDVRALQTEPEPYLWKHVVDVSANGTFSATYDFSDATPPTSFPLWVLGYRDQTEQTVTLTEATASVAFDSQTVTEGAVTIREVNLSHGGFLRLTGTNATYGTSAFLPEGHHEDVRIPLDRPVNESTLLNATVVADTNRNATLDEGDSVYTVNGTAVTDEALVRPVGSDQDDESTTTASTTSSTASSTTTGATVTTVTVNEAEEPLTPIPENETGGSSGGPLPLSPLLVVAAFALAGLLGRHT